MVNLAQQIEKPVDAILVWNFPHFARIHKNSMVYKAQLGKYVIQVVSINEVSKDTPTGQLLEKIIESLDEF